MALLLVLIAITSVANIIHSVSLESKSACSQFKIFSAQSIKHRRANAEATCTTVRAIRVTMCRHVFLYLPSVIPVQRVQRKPDSIEIRDEHSTTVRYTSKLQFQSHSTRGSGV